MNSSVSSIPRRTHCVYCRETNILSKKLVVYSAKYTWNKGHQVHLHALHLMLLFTWAFYRFVPTCTDKCFLLLGSSNHPLLFIKMCFYGLRCLWYWCLESLYITTLCSKIQSFFHLSRKLELPRSLFLLQLFSSNLSPQKHYPFINWLHLFA